MHPTVVGIDVGGERNGFHAVALQAGQFVDKAHCLEPDAVVDWCVERKAATVAVDAPCRWSNSESSRLVERELMRRGVHCFFTPARNHARANKSGFYDWVFNGERLYESLESRQYLRFDGEQTGGRICIETFPHAVVCAIAGRVISAKPKGKVRREVLKKIGYDVGMLSNIDFVDAALCAVAAAEFSKGSYQHFGNREEGFIIVPGRCQC